MPLDISDVQEFLRLDTQDDLETIQTLIKSANDIAERYCNRTLIQTEYQLFHDYLPAGRYYNDNFLQLMKGSIIAVSELKVHNDDGTTEVLTDFILTEENMDGKLYPLSTLTWVAEKSQRYKKGVEITYTAGYGANRSDIPYGMISGLLQIVAFLYENRGCEEVPQSILSSLNAFRIVTV